MNKNYNLKLDLQFKYYNNPTMEFDRLDNDTSSFFIRITDGGKLVDIENAIVILSAIKPNGKVESQFIEIENNCVYANLKPSMKDEIGDYTARAMLILGDKKVVTDTISYTVSEDHVFSLLNDSVQDDENFTLLTEMLSRLSTIETNEKTRVANEVDRLELQNNLEQLIQEVEKAEVDRKAHEVDREKLHLEMEDVLNEAKTINTNSKSINNVSNELITSMKSLNDNVLNAYNDVVEATKEIEIIENEVSENEAERQKFYGNSKIIIQNVENSEKTRQINEDTRISNEKSRELKVGNYEARYEKLITDTNNLKTSFEEFNLQANSNEESRVQAESDRENRYNQFESDYSALRDNINNNLQETNQTKNTLINELNQTKSDLTNTVRNEITSQTEKVNNKITEIDNIKNQMVYNATNATNEANKLAGVAESVINEVNNVKVGITNNVNTVLTSKVNEVNQTKTDLTNTVNTKINEIVNTFNTLPAQQQQDAEVITARDGEVSLKARLDRDLNNLNKELDRVKKIEESKVSTIQTESNFTTVEETNNGYFEDIKLEGKTLVNLANISSRFVENTSKYYIDHTLCETSKLDLNKPYTFIIYCNYLSNHNTNYNYFEFGAGNKIGNFSSSIRTNAKYNMIDMPTSGIYTMLLEFTDFKGCEYLACRPCRRSSAPVEGEIANYDVSVLLLEGDYTQNPQGYFEGIKSVAQDVDEITIKSVNGDGNLFDETVLNKYITSSDEDSFTLDYLSMYRDKFIYPIKTKGQHVFRYTCKETIGNKIPRFSFLYKDGTRTDINATITNEFVTYEKISDANKELIGIFCIYYSSPGNWVIKKNSIMLNKGIESKPYVPYKSDKKTLLYYNTESQTWEKPILCEWDTIKKHSDGKYYYHQRSKEIVLDGSRTWIKWEFGGFPNGYLFKNTTITDSCLTRGEINVYSDKYNSIIHTDNSSILDKSIVCASDGSICIADSSVTTVSDLITKLQDNPTTVVYQLSQEKIYECTNIDLLTYENETNYVVESGAITPKTTLKVHNNISNIVRLLQSKVSMLENNMTDYMVTQNRLLLTSRYSTDTVGFSVNTSTFSIDDTILEYDNDLYNLILDNILVGQDNYDRTYMENLIQFYWTTFIISDEMYFTLSSIIEEQYTEQEDITMEESPNEE